MDRARRQEQAGATGRRRPRRRDDEGAPEPRALGEARIAAALERLRGDEAATMGFLAALPVLERPRAHVVATRCLGPVAARRLLAGAFGSSWSPPAPAPSPESVGARAPGPAERLQLARARALRDVVERLLVLHPGPDGVALGRAALVAAGRHGGAAAIRLLDGGARGPSARRAFGSSLALAAGGQGAAGASAVRGGTDAASGTAIAAAAERRAATLYRRESAEAADADAEDPAVEAALHKAGGGQPLPPALRREMEERLGADLRHVRLHLDDTAARAARAVRALAFTVGDDVFFAAGTFAPDDDQGRRLLLHELTHVVQGQQGRIPQVAGVGRAVAAPDDALEREADAVARSGGHPSRGSAPATGGHAGAGGGVDRGGGRRGDGGRNSGSTAPILRWQNEATARPVVREIERANPQQLESVVSELESADTAPATWREVPLVLPNLAGRRPRTVTRRVARGDVAGLLAQARSRAPAQPATSTAPAQGPAASTRRAPAPDPNAVAVPASRVELPVIPPRLTRLRHSPIDIPPSEIPEVADFIHRLAVEYGRRLGARSAAARTTEARAEAGRIEGQTNVPGETRPARARRIAAASRGAVADGTSEAALDQQLVAQRERWLSTDFTQSVHAAHGRYGGMRLTDFALDWCVTRREQLDFQIDPDTNRDRHDNDRGFTTAPGALATGELPEERNPATGVLLSERLPGYGSESEHARVHPFVVTFCRRLRQHRGGWTVSTYGNHGSHGGRGRAGDFYVGGETADRFFGREAVRDFLRAVDETAGELGSSWSALYNDAAVARAINDGQPLAASDALHRPAAHGRVHYVANIDGHGGLNWHSVPNLHLHIDLQVPSGYVPPAEDAPRPPASGGQGTPAAPAR